MSDEIVRDSRDEVGRWLGRVWRRRFQLSEMLLERMGVGPGQVPILAQLKHHGELTQRELAEHTHVTAATISGTLKRMERAGTVYRTDDTRDARVSIVRLTEAGKTLVGEAWALFHSADMNMLQGFSDEECDGLLAYFSRMRENIDTAIERENAAQADR
ncbi:MAG: MarR family winged helix-turn-helix transcriptional regulator [Christensenellales bacterium]|jgi:DNA-binding MarR family transcriptional regulator